jgi:glutamate--cysteine ligase
LAREALGISRRGLKNRNRLNSKNQDEAKYLAPLERIAGEGRTVADDLLQRYHGRWRENIDHIFEEFAF